MAKERSSFSAFVRSTALRPGAHFGLSSTRWKNNESESYRGHANHQDAVNTPYYDKSLCRKARALFRNDRGIFRNGEALSRNGKALFQKAEAFFRNGEALFRNAAPVYRKGDRKVRNGRGEVHKNTSKRRVLWLFSVLLPFFARFAMITRCLPAVSSQVSSQFYFFQSHRQRLCFACPASR